ncbi:MAG TPA: hypothetical protein VEC37_02425 [Bacillota bacterium]|nr:hypothetical protein [Bacillota bacterium]
MKPHLSTQDLYCGAYILAKGATLEDIRLTGSQKGKPSVTFILSGHNVAELSKEFQSGHAEVNVVSFKVAMTHLKDMMFHTLRSQH